jgi:DNA-binding XRE family transcriptional regulator
MNARLALDSSAPCWLKWSPMHSSPAVHLDGNKGRIRPSPLGDRLRELRLDKGLTLREAADAAATSDNRICDWENGVSEPKLTTLARYSLLFGLTVSQLLHGVM